MRPASFVAEGRNRGRRNHAGTYRCSGSNDYRHPTMQGHGQTTHRTGQPATPAASVSQAAGEECGRR
jgi:hypothetical protein